MHNRPNCFFVELAGREPTTMDTGLRVVDVEKNIGTVDNAGEFNRVRGRFKRRHGRRRVHRFLRSIFSRLFPGQAWFREIPWE